MLKRKMLQPISTRILQAGPINHRQGNGAELESLPVATFLCHDRSQLEPGHMACRRLARASEQTGQTSVHATEDNGNHIPWPCSNAAAQTVANVSMATQAPCPTHGPARCHGNPWPLDQEDSHGRRTTVNTAPSLLHWSVCPELQTPPPASHCRPVVSHKCWLGREGKLTPCNVTTQAQTGHMRNANCLGRRDSWKGSDPACHRGPPAVTSTGHPGLGTSGMHGWRV